MPRWNAPPEFEEYVRDRHAELLRFAHALTGDPHLAGVGEWYGSRRRDDCACRRTRGVTPPGSLVRRGH